MKTLIVFPYSLALNMATFWRNHLLPLLSRALGQGVMGKTCRVLKRRLTGDNAPVSALLSHLLCMQSFPANPLRHTQ